MKEQRQHVLARREPEALVDLLRLIENELLLAADHACVVVRTSRCGAMWRVRRAGKRTEESIPVPEMP